jgi:hypothetical protein
MLEKVLLVVMARATVMWDFCSIQHSEQVVDEAQYFQEVFRDWKVPMSPLCPFHPVKLQAVAGR